LTIGLNILYKRGDKVLKNYFPQGICVGQLNINGSTIKHTYQKKGYVLKEFESYIQSKEIPCMIKSKDRGFCVLYGENVKDKADSFIESIVLLLVGALPMGILHINLFNFGKKRFLYLDALRQANIMHNAYTVKLASKRFEELEELVQERQYDYLTYDIPTISDYNVKNDSSENYHILLLNLEDFPDEYLSQKRLQNFFDTAYESGVYTILFAPNSITKEKELKSIKMLIERFKQIKIDQNFIDISQVFDTNLLKLYTDISLDFEVLDFDKKSFVEELLKKYKNKEDEDIEQNFLHIPIGKKGKDAVYFDFGVRSGVYSAFIAGMSGTGKSNLLNLIITQIAQQYTAKEIELVLMDYNEGGLEFAKYKNHPNCKKLFLNLRDQQPALDILKEFVDEMASRAELFNKMEVSSIEQYNKNYPQEIISYKILIIDEVQDMFSGEWKEQETFNSLLKQIAKKGRKYGLHFILATQSLDGINIDKSVIGQIGASISFRLRSEMDGMKIFGDKEAYSKVTKLQKYHFVYHTLTQTTVAKADFINPEKISDILEEIRDIRKPDEMLTPIVISRYQSEVKNEEAQENTQNIQIEENNAKNKDKYKAEKDLLELALKAKQKDPNAFVVEDESE